MRKKYVSLFVVLTLVSWSGLSSLAWGANFPVKPVRFIVPYSAGSGNDLQTRSILPSLEKFLGGRIIIENRPGADGRLGMNEAWKSKPDGYTIVNAGMPTPLINEKLFPVSYKMKEFVHLYAWSQDNVCLVGNAEVFKNTADFLKEARSRSLAGGISGIGSVSQITGLSLADAADFKPVNWVPFGGGSDTMVSLAGKHIEFGVTTTSSAKALVDAGKLRMLLIFSNEKDPTFPQATLPKEVGLNITAMPIVRGAVAPPGLPPAITKAFVDAFAKAVKDPEFLVLAKRARVEISPLNSQQFLNYTIGAEREITKYISKIDLKK